MFNMSAAQHGFRRRNFLRKQQCAFSWDWGPAFAPCGIWKPISLKLACGSTLVTNWNLVTEFDEENKKWLLKISIDAKNDLTQPVTLEVKIPELSLSFKQGFTVVEGTETLTFTRQLEESSIERWWPKGYGNPQLYTVEAYLRIAESSTEIGVLLETCVAANMNMVRIWGGGHYETDDFYRMCDELGLMVWQEFMFACSLYPTDNHFLDNVKNEVTDQVKRLMVHPSIVLWSGNNENQEFLVTAWDKASFLNPFLFTVDYHRLYIETIKSTLDQIDSTRSFISSSPSAGMISKDPFIERYKLQPSEKGLYGDVHFYDYKNNGLHVENYPQARFVSEYGAQSMPSFALWRTVSSVKDWHPLSDLSVFRNHHGNGQPEMLAQIGFQLSLPAALSTYLSSDPEKVSVSDDVRETIFDDFCYLTQYVQARSITSQTESYLRGRGEPSRTMGALYWQLNDIWPAATWSSIEHDDVLVSGFQAKEENVFHVHVSNDTGKAITGQITVQSVQFAPYQSTELETVPFEIGAHDSKRVVSVYLQSTEQSLLTATAFFLSEGEAESRMVEMLPQTWPTRDAFALSNLRQDPKIRVSDFRISASNTKGSYQLLITLVAEQVAGFVWLSWTDPQIGGYFSENAFWMLPGVPQDVLFYGRESGDVQHQDQLLVRSLFDVYKHSSLLG
ncbi:hypothetical protein BGZ83_008003 [Gryganskiella cystojenkinii]|nr:hypothetical protein BGZ83_008003 [Gryganskiella cystojenkinii]